MPHIFANMQHCWQNITYPWCQPFFPISAFLFQYKWWHTEIVKLHLLVSQQKSMRTAWYIGTHVPLHIFCWQIWYL